MAKREKGRDRDSDRGVGWGGSGEEGLMSYFFKQCHEKHNEMTSCRVIAEKGVHVPSPFSVSANLLICKWPYNCGKFAYSLLPIMS